MSLCDNCTEHDCATPQWKHDVRSCDDYLPPRDIPERVHARDMWEVAQWRNRAMRWILNEGEDWLETALDFAMSNWQRMSLIAKLGVAWYVLRDAGNPYYKHEFTAMHHVRAHTLNEFMRQAKIVIENGIANLDTVGHEAYDASGDESWADFVTSLSPDDDEWYLIDDPDMGEVW